MKKLTKILKLTPLVPLILGLSLFTSAQAATLADVVNSIEKFRTYVETKVNEGTEAVQKLLFEENPNKEQTIVANMGQKTVADQVSKELKQLSLDQVKKDLTENTSKMRTRLANIPASDIAVSSKALVSYLGSQKQKDFAVNDVFFDVESLMGEDMYKNQKAMDRALTYIRFLAIPSQPVSVSFEGIDVEKNRRQIAELQTSKAYEDLRINTRSLTALNSIALNNIYQLYSIRTPQKELGEAVGMVDLQTGEAIKDASALQVRDFLAQRRSRNPSWYDGLEEASPATVLREMTILLAEMRDELNEQRKDNERLLLSITAMQISNNTAIQKTQASDAQRISEQMDAFRR